MNKDFIEVLLKLQKELPIVERNIVAYKYKYAPLEKVWNKCGKIINDNGFVVFHEVSKDNVRTVAIHEKGMLTSTFYFSSETLKPQDRGAEITYGKRYNLSAIFNIIIEDEDNDAQPKEQVKEQQKAVKKLSLFETAEKALNECDSLEALEKTSKKIQEGKNLTEEEKKKLIGIGESIYNSLTK